MSSEFEERMLSRKRSRAANTEETPKENRKDTHRGDGASGGSKKARGRPRVDPRDATAADRRRTQIRLAQRAYRQRKETTISSLKLQSSQLHSIIEQMNTTFLRLNESALKSGLLQLNPALAQEFKRVTQTFTSLAQTASEGQYDVDEEQGENREPTVDFPVSIPKVPNISEEAQDVGWGYSVSNPTGRADMAPRPEAQPDDYFSQPSSAFGERGSTASLVRRRQFTVGDIIDQSRSQTSSDHQSTQQDRSIPLPFGLLDILSSTQAPFTPPNPHIFSVNIPTPEITPPTTRLPTPPLSLPNILSTKNLPSVTTYSFDETTFARRLTRAAIETGFQILSTANIRPSALSYVFKLSLPYFTVDELCDRFKAQLSRNIDQDLDWWAAPFIHLGGAGTHYPRRDASGRIIPIKNSWTVRQIGPLEKKMARIENVEDGRTEDLGNVDLSGFEGEWFDAHDVQGYLEEQYVCRIDPRSSFSECLVEEEGKDTATTTNLLPQDDPYARRASDESSDSPSLTHSSNTANSSSSSITPPTHTFDIPDAPFGLDMSFSNAQSSTYPTVFPKHVNYDISFDQTLGLDLAPTFDYGFAGTSGFSMGDVGLDLGLTEEAEESLPVVRQKRRKIAWLDVNRLTDELIKHAVCLGRAPGFRRKDVDMAVQKALIPAH
ncbi:hypothetical protein BKA66DRAFT_509725 [Pyrenochaeta sp. MPI-SDFR-AT-0127]|nr:hypothetical protein BKA66DRAFT_509725 [Pyrenochaeta sp. MPI-SDFR-AT-0127]